MILIGLGANLPSRVGAPRATLEAALVELGRRGVALVRRSRFWETAPVPAADQPWFVNAVALVETGLSATELLATLHSVEAAFGRERGTVNAARTLDLDLLAYRSEGCNEPGGLVLPHPRLAERAFVLLPLQEIAPDWRHPASGRSVAEMVAMQAGDQGCRPFTKDDEKRAQPIRFP